MLARSNPRPGLRLTVAKSRFASGYGSGRSSIASTKLKIAVLAPMPSASTRIATIE
jgi:hypothetical protein